MLLVARKSLSLLWYRVTLFISFSGFMGVINFEYHLNESDSIVPINDNVLI